MKYTCLFSAIAIMATSVSADLFGISGAVFTLWTGDNGDGTIVGPKEIEPHSYMSGKGCVNAGDEGLGSVSVQINLLKDFGDTDYCVLGYENLDCTGMMRVKHAINSANEKDLGTYKFEKTILSAKIAEDSCGSI